MKEISHTHDKVLDLFKFKSRYAHSKLISFENLSVGNFGNQIPYYIMICICSSEAFLIFLPQTCNLPVIITEAIFKQTWICSF